MQQYKIFNLSCPIFQLCKNGANFFLIIRRLKGSEDLGVRKRKSSSRMVCVSSCCFLWDTKAGCVAIGYLTGGLSFACCVGSLMRLFMGLPLILQNDDYQGEFPFNPLFYVFSAIYFAFHTVTSFGLVPAVKEGQTMFVVPSIVLLCADTVLSGVAIVVTGWKLVKYYDDLLIGGLGLAVILMTLLAYSTLLVISHLEEMFQLDQISLTKKQSSHETPSTDSSDGTVV